MDVYEGRCAPWLVTARRAYALSYASTPAKKGVSANVMEHITEGVLSLTLR